MSWLRWPQSSSTPQPQPQHSPTPPTLLGARCKPGESKEGTLLYFIEQDIARKIQEDPSYDDLEKMVDYVNNFDLVRGADAKVDTYFIDKCLRRNPNPLIGSSAASRTSQGGPRSEISHVTSQSNMSTGSIRLIPFQIRTSDHRLRWAHAQKAAAFEAPNYISENVVQSCGFPSRAGESISLTLTLMAESIDCSLRVQNMEEDMILSQKLLFTFGSYNPDYKTSDYANSLLEASTKESTAPSTSRDQGLARTAPDGVDPRVYETMMGLGVYMSKLHKS
ncbi:hypothetical protein F5Y16DRAFT_185403 [Xylariaceae sp. FL0255]|nr:hypothetical protein F5Y16DRAFT_185403 [Xylariaceae sp. FL0255]